jgi:hypothetical protein
MNERKRELAPTNPHWARVVGYGPFSVCVIHKEGLCPTSGDINMLMMLYKGLKKNSHFFLFSCPSNWQYSVLARLSWGSNHRPQDKIGKPLSQAFQIHCTGASVYRLTVSTADHRTLKPVTKLL